MYNALLDRVISVINQTVTYKPEEEQRSEFYNLMFNSEAYLEQQNKKRKNEELKTKLIVGATLAATVGEAYHLAKRSGILKRILKR